MSNEVKSIKCTGIQLFNKMGAEPTTIAPNRENLDNAIKNKTYGINVMIEIEWMDGYVNRKDQQIHNGKWVNATIAPMVRELLDREFPGIEYKYEQEDDQSGEKVYRGKAAVDMIIKSKVAAPTPYLCYVDGSYSSREDGQVVIVNPSSDTFWSVLDSSRNVALYLFHISSGCYYPITFKDGECTSPHNEETKAFIRNTITPLFGAKWDLAA